MAKHRMNCRRNGVRPEPEQSGELEAAGARAVSSEEMQIPAVDELPKPAGFGVEGSTSNSTSTLLAEYEVPPRAISLVRVFHESTDSNSTTSRTTLSVGEIS